MATNNKIRVVIDPNIIASVLAGGVTRTRFEWLYNQPEQFEICYSETVLSEIRQLADVAYFQKQGITHDRINRFIDNFQALALKIMVTSTVRQGRDANDYYLLSLARDARATLLVTGDRDLLKINPYGSVEILSMKAFYERFNADE